MILVISSLYSRIYVLSSIIDMTGTGKVVIDVSLTGGLFVKNSSSSRNLYFPKLAPPPPP